MRGNYDFQGRRFEILRDGTVRFDNAPLNEIDPRLDIRTRRVIQGVEARVNVRGTLKQPEIVLSSTPPLEQADILSLIVFNQPINSLGEGQQISLAQRAQALATGAVAGQLAQSIGNALGVDMFEISTAPENGGAAALTIGQQVGQNLYVRVQQGVGDQSQTNFILEYELTEWLRLQTNVLQGSSDAAVAVPARCRAAASICCSSSATRRERSPRCSADFRSAAWPTRELRQARRRLQSAVPAPEGLHYTE